MAINEKLEFAKKVVYESGELIRKQMSESLTIDTKQNKHDFVTNVDKSTEVYIVKQIKDNYENQDFITEEKSVSYLGNSQVWILDPIDGTTNFIYQKQNFAVSLAYYEGGKPVFGIVYDVTRDEMFVGVNGEGSFLNEKILSSLDMSTRLDDAIVSSDLPTLRLFDESLESKMMVHRYVGAAAIDTCNIAAGRTNVYIARRLNVWDIAAANIILNEVCGKSSIDGDETLKLVTHPVVYIAASNDEILKDLLELYKGK
ncbi:MAG: inositol monophosphatase family protein [Erysipelothrix sp.]